MKCNQPCPSFEFVSSSPIPTNYTTDTSFFYNMCVCIHTYEGYANCVLRAACDPLNYSMQTERASKIIIEKNPEKQKKQNKKTKYLHLN